MKNMKKILALLVAVLMIAASVSAFAADDKTITISVLDGDTGEHEYSAYQVFSGTIDGSELTNIQWGANVTAAKGAALIAAIQGNATLGAMTKVAALTSASTAADLAAALADITSDTDNAALLGEIIADWVTDQSIAASAVSAKSGNSYVISSLAEGYYFVKETGTIDSTKQSAQTNYILKLVESINVTPKADIPTVEKKVDDKQDSTGAEDAISWQDSADYDVGDTVPYKLTGTLPSNFDTFEKYEYKFTDNLSKGLSFKADSIAIYYYASKAAADADTAATPTGTNITGLFDITPTSDTDGASESVVTITAKAGADSKYLRGSDTFGNNGAIVVRYNCVLTDDAVYSVDGAPNVVYLEYSSNPNGDGKGKTKEDKVTVLKFKLVVDKVQPGETEGTTKPLYGAGFTLLKKYNKPADVPASAATYTSESGTLLPNSVASDYAVTGEQVWAVVETINDTNNTAKFAFNGLDDGDYMLVETTVPDGFNAASPKKFTVKATHDVTSDDPKLTKLEVVDSTGAKLNEFIVTLSAAQIDVDVLNNSGTTLPSTGGMGTTLLYVGGSILVVLAAILLITKRRMSGND